MRIYGLKNCDSCRAARKALPGAGFVDLRADGIADEVLSRAIATFGAALINTRSTTWRGLDEAQRALPPADLIAAHPAVMKRPLIEDGQTLYLGWGAPVKQALGVC